MRRGWKFGEADLIGLNKSLFDSTDLTFRDLHYEFPTRYLTFGTGYLFLSDDMLDDKNQWLCKRVTFYLPCGKETESLAKCG